jgi:hypothetical protein
MFQNPFTDRSIQPKKGNMKNLFFLLLLTFTSVFFTGCLETTEELTISADGTGM